MEQLERRVVARCLVDHGGNRTRAAETLGISRQALQAKLARWRDQGMPLRREASDPGEGAMTNLEWRVETDEAGVRHLGEARHQRHEGLHVLNLHGGPYDMAFQHGALLREAIPRGPLPFFEQYLTLLLRNSPVGTGRRGRRAVARRLDAAAPARTACRPSCGPRSRVWPMAPGCARRTS